MRAVVGASLLWGTCAAGTAAIHPAASPRHGADIDATQRRQIVDALASHIAAGYLNPQLGRRIGQALRQHEARGDDDAFTQGRQLADALSTQMQQVTPDKHLYVTYSAEAIPADRSDDSPSPAERAAELAQMKAHDYGIDDVRRLPFNIGYLRLEVFLPAKDAGDVLTTAMNLLANTDALIIDLRDNHGGDQNTVALIASYLFDKRTHLNDFYYAKGRRLEQMWTSEYVPGPRYGGSKDVYILTNEDTASAAEDFSYDLQHLKRALVVGGTTAGAAHCGDMVRLTAHFSAMVPDCRGINPVTGTDWEGTGVAPDLKVPARDAFETAEIHALRKMLTSAGHSGRAQRIRARIAEVEARHPDGMEP